MHGSLTFALHEMITIMDHMAHDMLKQRYGISFRKFYVLAVLASCEPSTQAFLAECMGQSPAAISKSVAVLESEGYIEVNDDPTHGRKNLVSLTEKGKQLVRDAEVFLEATFLEKLTLTENELTEYLRITIKMRDQLFTHKTELSP
jgi:DNA-binding MarR family transcriptional regulator